VLTTSIDEVWQVWKIEQDMCDADDDTRDAEAI
jgi:hypothetical protein